LRGALVAAIAALVIATSVIVATTDHTPARAPPVAVEKLKELWAHRVLNDYFFGGYLIFQGIPTVVSVDQSVGLLDRLC